MYRVLASLAPLHNSHFTALLLPTAITIDPARRLLVLPNYDGEDLAARWHESDGGARLGLGLATTIPAVLDDLAHIDTACVTTDPVLSEIPGRSSTTPRPSPARPARPPAARPGLLSPKTAPRPSGCWPTAAHAHDREQRRLLPQKPHRAAGRPHRDRRLGDLQPQQPVPHRRPPRERGSGLLRPHVGQPGLAGRLPQRPPPAVRLLTASFAKGIVIQALELANMWMNDTDMHLAAIQTSIITGMLAKAPDR